MSSMTVWSRSTVCLCALNALLMMGSAGRALAQPANDNCANAIPISDGDTAFSTVGATTDGPGHAGTCPFDGQTYEDIWFQYTATCTGELTVSTCGTINYDSDLVIYDGCDCGTLTSDLLGCNDDGPGCTGFSSIVTVPIVQGNCYFIRVGGWNANNEGSGTVNVSCVDHTTTPGACCHADDTCTSELLTDCDLLGGTFMGFLMPCTPNPCAQSAGPDVVYTDVNGITNWGATGGIRAYSLGSHTCNIGTQNLPWGGTSPLLAMNAYRIYGGRLEQIGMSWVKNGTGAAAGDGCGFNCNGAGGSVLGAGCLDVYGSSFNGGQGILGPRSAVNAFTGAYPGQSSPTSGTIAERLQVKESDMSTTNFPGARFLVEGVYVAAADATAGNSLNNASYKRVTVSGTSYDMTPTGAMQETIPAIYAWQFDGLGTGIPDPAVSVVIADVPDEGRFFVGSKATDLGEGIWRYDYAVYNLNSHRSAGWFFVPLAPEADKDNIGFHDVDYHSGEPYANTDWVNSISPSGVAWSSPQTFDQNANTNALRWGTMYNFWFETNVPPATGDVTIGLFRPGTPTEITATATIPSSIVCKADCSVDGHRDGSDVEGFAACLMGAGANCGCADMNDSGTADLADVEEFVNMLLDGADCP